MTETSGHEKGGPEPAFFVSVRGQSETGAEADGDSNHGVIEQHAHKKGAAEAAPFFGV